jgi:hypothetical protein
MRLDSIIVKPLWDEKRVISTQKTLDSAFEIYTPLCSVGFKPDATEGMASISGYIACICMFNALLIWINATPFRQICVMR